MDPKQRQKGCGEYLLYDVAAVIDPTPLALFLGD